MAFVKLDTSILDSSLWMERVQREIFITTLLMARPKEFTSPAPQYEVRQLKPTGFVVPPGWYGFVSAAASGIIRKAAIDKEEGMIALEQLGSEDPESRSSDHGGRRLVRVDGGYVVLNYMSYRDKDHTAAERMRRLRERKKQSESRNGRNRYGVTVTGVTQADADADAEDKKPSDAPASAEETAELEDVNSMRARMAPPQPPIDLETLREVNRVMPRRGTERPPRRQ